jgi:cell division protein ZapE
MESLAHIYDDRLASAALRPDEDQRRAVAMLDAFCRAPAPVKAAPPLTFWQKLAGKSATAAQDHKQGFYFYGGVGRGKTMIMDMFFAASPERLKRRVHFHAFMLEVHDALHNLRTARTEKDRIDGDLIAVADKIAAGARLLCFDEFHVKDVADAMILGRLFTALFARGVRVVMTSNIAPDELYKDGLQRDRFIPFIQLLKARLEVVEFTGATDYRLGRMRGVKTYYWPHDADAHAEMQKIFSTVADGAAGEAMDIVVKGRAIHVPKCAKEIAWFSFAELCDTAKSAVDYLELTKIFRIFVIENVPQLDDMKHNATLRFITLVDTLYDHHARVVVSAATLPENLYKGEMHAAAFGRTVSRLIEMQSKDYGA